MTDRRRKRELGYDVYICLGKQGEIRGKEKDVGLARGRREE